ncbi:MAG: hypothetical protein IPQ07_26465 [Myxococcales bacterium]|nr:hypothetical protein [Myxococcales bacterium]
MEPVVWLGPTGRAHNRRSTLVAALVAIATAGACSGDGGVAKRCAPAREALAPEWKRSLDLFAEIAGKFDLTWNKLPRSVLDELSGSRAALDPGPMLEKIRKGCHDGTAADCHSYGTTVEQLLQRYTMSKDFAVSSAPGDTNPADRETYKTAMEELNVDFQNLITAGVPLVRLAGRELAVKELCSAGGEHVAP